jgi:iron uptake system component EfeO
MLTAAAAFLGLAAVLGACSAGPAATDPTGSAGTGSAGTGSAGTGPASSSGTGQAGPGGSGSPAAVPSVRQVQVSISDAGCSPQTLSLPSGPTTFVVTNRGSSSVLEYEIEQSGRIIGEVENVIPGIDRTFTLNLKPGAYILNCPGGTSAATGTLTVTE